MGQASPCFGGAGRGGGRGGRRGGAGADRPCPRGERGCAKDGESEKKTGQKEKREADTQRALAITQRALADKHFQQAWNAVEEMITRVSEEKLAHIPGASKVRRELLLRAKAFYEEFLL